MKCPQCQHEDTKVIDSRDTEQSKKVRRRRECVKCSYRFTTLEKIIVNDLIVKKTSWSTQVYDRDKLIKSIKIACTKRNISDQDIESMVEELEQKRITIPKGEISSEQIWLDVLIELKQLDPVAYVRFASVYMNFENIQDFQHILNIE